MNKDLHSAICRGDLPAVMAFLDSGADIQEEGWHGLPLLTEAAADGHVELVRALLARGANRDARDRAGDKTALHWAAMHGHCGAVHALLEAGAEVDLRDSFALYTPLILATTQGGQRAQETIAVLLSYGADINARTKWGTTALFSAAYPGDPELVEFLVHHGADLGARDNQGQTVLFMFAKYGVMRGDPVRHLLSLDLDPDARDSRGRTALMLACLYGQHPVVEALLEAGGLLNLQDMDGRSALIHASSPAPEDSRIGQIRKHISSNKGGEGIYSLLREKQQTQAAIIDLLLKHGADPTLRDVDGLTALEWANRQST